LVPAASGVGCGLVVVPYSDHYLASFYLYGVDHCVSRYGAHFGPLKSYTKKSRINATIYVFNFLSLLHLKEKKQ
jgi:hypothetical protein